MGSVRTVEVGECDSQQCEQELLVRIGWWQGEPGGERQQWAGKPRESSQRISCYCFTGEAPPANYHVL